MHCLFMPFAQISKKVGVFLTMSSALIDDGLKTICLFYIQAANIFTSFLFTYYLCDLKKFCLFNFSL